MSSPTGAKILLVDDSKTMRHVLRVHLSGSDHDFVEADSGRSALDILARSDVDLIVSDIRMADIDGLELVRRVRQNERFGRHLPIILISGDRSADLRGQCLKSGADDFIEKPLDPERLRRSVGELLEAARASQRPAALV